MECKIDNCPKVARVRGMCSKHYVRWSKDNPHLLKRKPRATSPDGSEKRCPICTEVKPASAFSRSKKGIYTYCKECFNAKRRAATIQNRLDNPPPPRPTHCSVDGCSKEFNRNRLMDGVKVPLCRTHYNYAFTGKTLAPLTPHRTSYINDDVRRCTYCEIIQPQAAFYASSGGGKQSTCKTCFKAVQTFNANLKAGNLEKCLRAAESMPERIQLKYLDRLSTAINQGQLERSRESGAVA